MTTSQTHRSNAAPTQPVCNPASAIELSPMQCQHIGGGVGPAGRAALARQLAWKLPDGPGMVPLDPPIPSPY